MNTNISKFKNKVQLWAEKITDAHSNCVQAIIEVGKLLNQAKADCNHGEWGELTGETTGKPMLPFSHRTERSFR